MPHPNVFEAQVEYDASDPAGFASGAANVGKLAGATENAVKLFELPPGVKLCPYHYEFVEEWLLVLVGSVDLRGPDGSETVAAMTRSLTWVRRKLLPDGSRKPESIPYGRSSGVSENSTPRASSSS